MKAKVNLKDVSLFVWFPTPSHPSYLFRHSVGDVSPPHPPHPTSPAFFFVFLLIIFVAYFLFRLIFVELVFSLSGLMEALSHVIPINTLTHFQVYTKHSISLVGDGGKES